MSVVAKSPAGEAIMQKLGEASHRLTESRRAVIELAIYRNIIRVLDQLGFNGLDCDFIR